MAKNEGRKKPTKLKKLQGTDRKDRQPNNEMMPIEVSSLEPSVTLVNKFADDIWIKLTRNLSAIGMLNEIDQELLMAYCNEMGIYFDCMQKVKEEGYLIISPANGEIIGNYLKIGNTALANSIKLSDKFGFNPAARTKIEMPSKPKEDSFGDLL